MMHRSPYEALIVDLFLFYFIILTVLTIIIALSISLEEQVLVSGWIYNILEVKFANKIADTYKMCALKASDVVKTVKRLSNLMISET